MPDEIVPQPQIKISWLIGTVAAFAIFLAIGGYSARMTRDYTDYDQDRAAQRKITLAKVREEEGKLINPVDKDNKPTAEWVDQDKGLIRIPIEEAMAEEVETLKTQAPAMGIDINPPAPAAPPAAPSTNAAPSAPTVPASTNTAPAAPTQPASTNAAPAKPAKPKKK